MSKRVGIYAGGTGQVPLSAGDNHKNVTHMTMTSQRALEVDLSNSKQYTEGVYRLNLFLGRLNMNILFV